MKAKNYNSPIIDKVLSDISSDEFLKVSTQMALASEISDKLTELNISNYELAKILNVDNITIEYILSGTFEFKNKSMNNKIEQLLGIKII